MTDLELALLELKAMRIKNKALETELRVMRRYRTLVEKVSEMSKTLSDLPRGDWSKPL